MQRAVWTWDAATAKEALGEAELEGEVPDGLDGKALMMQGGDFSEGDREKINKMLERCAFLFLQDQCMADEPFKPPEGCEGRAAYLWGAEMVKEAVGECELSGEVPEMDGKALLMQEGDLAEADRAAVNAMLSRVGFMFMQDMVANA